MKVTYYKYEEKHSCPKCNGILRYTGALNQFDWFECLDCKTNFQVENFYKIENMEVVFDRYGEIEELN